MAAQCRAAGFTVREMRDARYELPEFKAAGYELRELKALLRQRELAELMQRLRRYDQVLIAS